LNSIVLPARTAHWAGDTVIDHEPLEQIAGLLAAAIRMMLQSVRLPYTPRIQMRDGTPNPFYKCGYRFTQIDCAKFHRLNAVAMTKQQKLRTIASRRGQAHAVEVRALTDAERQELKRVLLAPSGLEGRAAELLNRFLLAEVVNGALGSLSLDELLRRLIALASHTIEAERGTIFLLDGARDELFSRIMQGEEVAEIRIRRGSGIAGAVFDSGRSEIVADAYADTRFNPTVDEHTGYRTRSLACVPLRKRDGTNIGVFELLNKRKGKFTAADVTLLQVIANQAAGALEHAQIFEEQSRERRQDQRLLDMTESVTVELELDRLLVKLIEASATLLNGERASLFVHDPTTGELCSRVTAGAKVDELRFRDDIGIAGATFRTGETINARDVYADSRFNPDIDACTGYKTRNLISVPVMDQAGRPMAVLQVLNGKSGQFTSSDERRLYAFASQAGIALQNARLFSDVLALKTYAEGLLRSLPDGVIRLDPRFNILSANEAASKLLGIDPERMLGQSAEVVWGAANPWLIESLAYVSRTGHADHRPDVDFALASGAVASVNATVAPLRDGEGTLTGITLIVQDIDRQKKVQATFSRYMAKEFADLALSGDTAPQTVCATMLFSDIRRFTTIAEALTPRDTVDMLNEYFSEMAEIVQKHRGVLDKYIGDAVMAVFGAVVESAADADNAVAAAIEMLLRLRELNERRQSRGAQALEIGIGLASGEIVSGPIGSPNRMNYTVIGDSVNLASRLESANKLYSTSVLMAGPTVERLVTPVRLRRIDLMRVKGKETPTEIFELLEHYPPHFRTMFDQSSTAFEAGIRHYRARRWTRALEQFAAVLSVMPNDGPSWVYTDRCLYYRDHAPPDHWDGVWTMKTK
jgi:adenylate cyclase